MSQIFTWNHPSLDERTLADRWACPECHGHGSTRDNLGFPWLCGYCRGAGYMTTRTQEIRDELNAD